MKIEDCMQVNRCADDTVNGTFGFYCLIGMIKELDYSVGSIIKTLSKKGILGNTIVVFFSDNGAPSEGVHLYRNSGSNWPLRGVSNIHLFVELTFLCTCSYCGFSKRLQSLTEG